jgi:AraC-like DNA-binding protein
MDFMQKTKLLVKGMVCNRCVMVVSNELQSLGYETENVKLGEVNIMNEKEINLNKVGERLGSLGFGLVQDQKIKLVNEVKKMVEDVYSGEYDFPNNFRFSDLIKKRWNNYEMVSDAFIAIEQKTLETYIIQYRLDRAKEFLVYTDDTLADIAFKLNYNSAAYLSAQFKQFTGLTPSHFKSIKTEREQLGMRS